MVEQLQPEEVNSQTDPTVAKQWDDQTPKTQQWHEFYETVDQLKIGLLVTNRPDVGPVARSMAIAKRSGPDFLFLANAHSKKFQDLSSNKDVTITFQNSSNQDWVSVTGVATTTSNEDPRIKQVYTKMTSAWFGDLKDGTHNGTPSDPRMKLIEVKAKCMSWRSACCTLANVSRYIILESQCQHNRVLEGDGDSHNHRRRRCHWQPQTV